VLPEPLADRPAKRPRTTRNEQRRRILEEMVNCPECGISLQMRCLAWRHTCAPEKDLREELLKTAHAAFYRRKSGGSGAPST
jgi:hypothetical protein